MNSVGLNSGVQELSHVSADGKARMVDVSEKPKVRRIAYAAGKIEIAPKTAELIRENQIAKGDVIAAANFAGIMAAKKTAEWIPLCHQIAIEQVVLGFKICETCIEITAEARCTDKTGIEMEVLTAVSAAALTIYDMCKAVDKNMKITEIYLVKKIKEIVEL